MAARPLYPGWGTGPRGRLDTVLTCYSFGCVGRAELEHSDKIILPATTLREVSRLRLPFPLYFFISSMRNIKERRSRAEAKDKRRRGRAKAGKDTKPYLPKGQYCGVLEFSAPKDTAYLPSWMMKNIGVREAGKVHLMSVLGVPKGVFCKFEPHEHRFVRAIRQLGPKFFLEAALRHYSILSVGQRIVIEHNGEQFHLNVLETKPEHVITIMGHVDLEVEFAPSVDIHKYLSKQEEQDESFSMHINDDEDEDELLKKAMAMSLAGSDVKTASPERAQVAEASDDDDGMGWGMSTSFDAEEDTSAAPAVSSGFQGASTGYALGGPVSAGHSLAQSAEEDDVKQTAPPAASSGYRLSGSPGKPVSPGQADGKVACPNCGRRIPAHNITMHSVHCSRAFTKCQICNERIPRNEVQKHTATHEQTTCSLCNEQMEQRRLESHALSYCPMRPTACPHCGLEVPHRDYTAHELECGDRSNPCKECSAQVKVRDRATHPLRCRPICGCGQAVLASEMDTHKQLYCVDRKVQCPYCRLPHKASDTAHQERCGSRTEQCDQCGRWVQLKDLGLHRDSSCLFPEPSTRAAADPAASSAPPVQADDEVSSVSQTLSALNLPVDEQLDVLEQDLMARISALSPTARRGDSSSASGTNSKPGAGSSGSSRRQQRSGGSAAGGVGHDAPGTYPCPLCRKGCADFEALQMHMLTQCSRRSETANAAPASGSRRRTHSTSRFARRATTTSVAARRKSNASSSAAGARGRVTRSSSISTRSGRRSAGRTRTGPAARTSKSRSAVGSRAPALGRRGSRRASERTATGASAASSAPAVDVSPTTARLRAQFANAAEEDIDDILAELTSRSPSAKAKRTPPKSQRKAHERVVLGSGRGSQRRSSGGRGGRSSGAARKSRGPVSAGSSGGVFELPGYARPRGSRSTRADSKSSAPATVGKVKRSILVPRRRRSSTKAKPRRRPVPGASQRAAGPLTEEPEIIAEVQRFLQAGGRRHSSRRTPAGRSSTTNLTMSAQGVSALSRVQR